METFNQAFNQFYIILCKQEKLIAWYLQMRFLKWAEKRMNLKCANMNMCSNDMPIVQFIYVHK